MSMKSCIENNPLCLRRMRYLMNTFCSIQAEGEDSAFIKETIDEAFLELKRIEGLFSRYINSPVAELNRYASESAVKVDAEVFCLIARSLEFSRVTSGAFDISIGSAIDLWRLSEKENILPTQGQIEELKTRIGFQNIILDFDNQSIRFSRPAIQIDLGALAKGYALDRAAAVLKQKGLQRAQINLGGNIYIINSQPQALAIRNPIYPERAAATVDLADSAISTSANYERFFTIGGKRFGHLFNPLTGCPVESEALSVSIISQDATLADALSTAIFVLGIKKGSELLKDIKGVEAIIICRSKWGRQMRLYNMKGGN